MMDLHQFSISLQVLTKEINEAVVTALRSGVPPDVCHAALEAAREQLAAVAPLIHAAREGERQRHARQT